MDPIGFGLESFDGVGRFRAKDFNGHDIDTSGSLPGGKSFSSALQLAEIIAKEHDFKRCVATKTMEYALARKLNSDDHCAVSGLAKSIGSESATFSDLIVTLITSDYFRFIGGKK